MKSVLFVLVSGLVFSSACLAQNTQVILSEDFEGLQLGPNVDEGVSGDAVWTDIPPAGWILDDSGVPGAGTASDGVTEWAGWGFANKDWWVQTAGDQDRSLWEQGSGTVMITDPDEWDDAGHPGGEFNAFVSTAPIDLSLAVAGTAQLSFDSSWRDYAQQTGTVTVSYDGGPAIEVVLLDSEGITAYVPPENETITVDLNNPAGAQSAVITFGMTHAGNDWWWAVDTIVVTADIRLDLAFHPAPRHNTNELSPKAILSWTPGQYVGGLSPQHRVLLSANRDVVEDGSAVVATLDANSLDVTGLLDYGTTYYWRVDEANRTSDWDVGGIWEFTTEPYSIPVQTVTATASSSNANMGPERTLNGIGLNELDQHSTESTDMWLSGMGDATPAIQYAFDKAYKLHEMWVWNSNQLIESFVGLGAKDVVIETSLDNTNWAVLGDVHQLAQANGSPTYTANTKIDFGGTLARYVKITVTAGWGVLPQFGLSEVRFYYIPTFAREPVPAVDALSAGANVLLQWRPGREAVAHEVYLGTDPEALALMATTTDNSYAPGDLVYDTTYYWQVTEVNDQETPSAYTGQTWRFSTPTHGTVDDFDQYDDDCQRIFFAWQDGLGHNGGEEIEGCDEPAYNGNGGGSIVGHSMAPFAERDIVYGGRQSLPFNYDNAFGDSFATLGVSGQDWTANGVQTLSLFFRGVAGNTGTLYVKINNTKLTYDGDAADIAATTWQPWNIDLTALNGLENVTSLTIGVDGANAAGMLYIDNIRLYPLPGQQVTPTDPGNAQLVAHYAFDGNANDSSGNGYHGAENGTVTYAPGVVGQALRLDGFTSYVSVDSVGISGAAPRTIAGWAKANSDAMDDWTNIFGFTGSSTGGEHFDMEIVGATGTTTSGYFGLHRYGWEMDVLENDLEWHHLAASFDGATIHLYGDGRLVNTATVTNVNTPGPVHMGKRQDNENYFHGLVDDVRIYDTALTAGEIAWIAGRRAPMHKAF